MKHVDHRLVKTDGQLSRVLLPGGELEEQGRLVDLGYLLMNGDVVDGGLIPSAVPAQEVHVGEDLFELLLLGVVILSVDDDAAIHRGVVQLKTVHQLDVSPVLLPNQSSVNLHWSSLLSLGPEVR